METIVTFWGVMEPRGHCDIARPYGAKDPLGHYGASWNHGETIQTLHSLLEPRGHCDTEWHCGTKETIVTLRGPMEPWRPL